MEQEKNCAFQYAKMKEGIFRDTKIIEDKSELTLDEAKKLWNAHFADAAKWIKDGNTVEMAVEQAQFSKATADYQATLMFLESRISGIRKALRGE